MRWMALVLALTAPAALAQDPVIARAEARESEAWIGERASIYLTVLMNALPDHTPRMDLPAVTGALFLKAPSSPVLGTETIDGAEYTSQRFELMVFAQREGSLQVPAIGVRVSLAGEEYTIETEPVSLTAKRPDGVPAGSALITTPELRVEERWDPLPEVATVGDAFVRTISIRAGNVMGLAIPPPPMPEVAGLAAYPGEPTVEDKMQRGVLSASRRDSVTFVCERAGTVEIPPLVYRWWNPEERRLQEKELPGFTFEVAALPASATLDEEAAEPDRATPAWVWIAGLLVAAGLFALWLFREPLSRLLEQRAAARAASEPEAFRRLLAACREGDPAQAWRALIIWIDRAGRVGAKARDLSVHEFLLATGDAELANEAEELQRALIGEGQAWSGARMAPLLEQARRKRLAHEAAPAALQPLNPVGASRSS